MEDSSFWLNSLFWITDEEKLVSMMVFAKVINTVVIATIPKSVGSRILASTI